MAIDLSTLYRVDDDGSLFISPIFTAWSIVDLEGGLDECIPSAPIGCLYGFASNIRVLFNEVFADHIRSLEGFPVADARAC